MSAMKELAIAKKLAAEAQGAAPPPLVDVKEELDRRVKKRRALLAALERKS